MKYMHRDSRSGNWLYKRQFPDRKWFVRALHSTIQQKAEQSWWLADMEYERIARSKLVKAPLEASKQLRGDEFWKAGARFLSTEGREWWPAPAAV
jgi:hypothetical protein